MSNNTCCSWRLLCVGLMVLLCASPVHAQEGFGSEVPVAGPRDSDKDGLLDDVEAMLGTDPNNPDTDGDGRSDGVEMNIDMTSPLSWWQVTPPSIPGVRRFLMRTFAKVPRIITSWLPRRLP